MDPKNIFILIIGIPKKGTPTLGKPQRWGEASISIHKLRRDTVKDLKSKAGCRASWQDARAGMGRLLIYLIFSLMALIADHMD